MDDRHERGEVDSGSVVWDHDVSRPLTIDKGNPRCEYQHCQIDCCDMFLSFPAPPPSAGGNGQQQRNLD